MKIAVDLLGGDYAPEAVIAGVGIAIRRKYVVPEEVAVIGTKETLHSFRLRYGIKLKKVKQVECSQIITMDESVISAIRKKDSSIARGFTGLKQGEFEAFISAGNTAAMVSFSRLLGRLRRDLKPAIAAPLPNLSGPCLLIDAGANSGECAALDLAHFALMGSLYAEKSWRINSPVVALLSNGTEEAKGTATLKAAYRLLRERADLNFIGFVEGDRLFDGPANVVVCDGFVGNVVLKSNEGLAHFIAKKQGLFWKVAKLVKGFFRKADYQQVGGAPLLGVNGTVIIAHGKSLAPVIANAIKAAVREVEVNINSEIAQRING